MEKTLTRVPFDLARVWVGMNPANFEFILSPKKPVGIWIDNHHWYDTVV